VNEHERIVQNPKFKALVAERSRFAMTLSVAILVIYFGFILLVAFAKPLLAIKVGGGVTSLGILVGLFVIVAAFVLTGIYVARANGRYDRLTRELTEEITR
jgi:uncharacterized membrane protein (DUF485 family)